jgi:MarR family transcriptional regulator, transcriptional regulator for hemolysin
MVSFLPMEVPLGREIADIGKTLQRAFAGALAEAGGSIPSWQVLLALELRGRRTQHELAQAIGIEGPTLTRQLDALEQAGLVLRNRDPLDRRAIRVEPTDRGRALFEELMKAARAFDERLRGELSEDEIAQLRRLLAEVKENVTHRETRVGKE